MVSRIHGKQLDKDRLVYCQIWKRNITGEYLGYSLHIDKQAAHRSERHDSRLRPDSAIADGRLYSCEVRRGTRLGVVEALTGRNKAYGIFFSNGEPPSQLNPVKHIWSTSNKLSVQIQPAPNQTTINSEDLIASARAKLTDAEYAAIVAFIRSK